MTATIYVLGRGILWDALAKQLQWDHLAVARAIEAVIEPEDILIVDADSPEHFASVSNFNVASQSIGITSRRSMCAAMDLDNWRGIIYCGPDCSNTPINIILDCVMSQPENRWRPPELHEFLRMVKRYPPTPMEWRVACLTAQGLTAPQIAKLLNRSIKTIGVHHFHLHSKLGISSQLALQAWVQAIDNWERSPLIQDHDPLPGDTVAQCGVS